MGSHKFISIILDVAIVMLGVIVAFFSGWLILQQQDITENEVQEVNIFTTTSGKAALLESRVGAAAKHGADAVSNVKETARAEREKAEQEKTEKETVVEVARAWRDISAYINLQPVVDRWLATYSFTEAAIEIYDVDYGTVAASYRAGAYMSPRSIYKLFYVYDGYAQIDAGLEDANQTYLGDLSLGYCLDIMVRQSNNPCAETMLADEPRLQRVGQLIANLGLTSTQSDGLVTSAHDVSLLLQHYYAHPEWSESSWYKFRDSALNQSFAYRKGLPAGFSVATVYDKTGFGSGYDGNGHYVYNDAAIVEFALADGTVRRYIMVVMTSDPSSYIILTRLGEMLEEAIIYI